MNAWYIIITLLIVVPSFSYAIAQTSCPSGQLYDNGTGRCTVCWEKGTCAFTEDPFGVMMMPFERIFKGLTIMIMWSLLISILWLRTQNPMLIGVVGIAMTAAYMTMLPASQSNEFDGARIIGGVLFCVSLGISVYHLINTRLFQPPS